MIATHKNRETSENKKSVNAALSSGGEWKSIKWDYHRMIVKKLQLRTLAGNTVKEIQEGENPSMDPYPFLLR